MAGTNGMIPKEEALGQLERILAHPLFVKSRHLAGFLRYVVERTVAGDVGSLKEVAIGRDVFRRGDSFDPRTDNVVRVNANRLRSRLAEYYVAAGRNDPVVIEIPRGGYLPVFGRAVLVPAGQPPVAAHGDATVSVGRDAERGQLASAFDRICRSAAEIVSISGDPGLGKTTIAEEFLRQTGESGAAWVAWGRCSERLCRTDAFVPVLESLDGLLRGAGGDQVGRLMAECAPSWLASVAPPGEGPSFSPGVASPGAASRERMRREFVRFFEALAAIRPVVLFLDDMHWTDESTCDLLAYLRDRIDGLRLLVILTFRPAEVTGGSHPLRPLHLAWLRKDALTEIPLKLLTAGDVGSYLDRRFPDHTFPPRLGRIIHERTEGHPLFMTDLVGHLRARDVLSLENGHWAITRDPEQIGSTIPATTKSMIELQIDQLTPEQLSLLQCGAVQGVRFDAAVVARVLSLEAGEVEEEFHSIQRLHRLVCAGGESADGHYSFIHVLYQNVLYSGLSSPRRSALSRAVAEALVEGGRAKTGTEAAQIAVLFETAGELWRASEYFLRATAAAARVFAFPETTALAERGLSAVLAVEKSAERDARELALLLHLGMAQMSMRGFAAPEVDHTHRRARELCLRLSDTRHLVRVLWRLHTCQVNAGNLIAALELAKEMRNVAEQAGTQNAVVESLHAYGTTLGFMGRLGEARAHLQRIFEVAPLEKHSFDTSLYVLDPCVTSLSLLARFTAMAGELDDALDKALASLKLATDLAHPPSLTYATFWAGSVQHARGEYSGARDRVETAMDLARTHGLPQFVEWGRIVRGSSLAALDRLDEGIEQMRISLKNQPLMGSRIERPYCLTLLAEALARNGAQGEAISLCTDALDIADRTEARSYEAEGYRVRAKALKELGRIEEAEKDCMRALETARSAGCRALELRAAVSAFRLTRSGPAELRETLRGFARESDSPLVAEARVLLAGAPLAAGWR